MTHPLMVALVTAMPRQEGSRIGRREPGAIRPLLLTARFARLLRFSILGRQ